MGSPTSGQGKLKVKEMLQLTSWDGRWETGLTPRGGTQLPLDLRTQMGLQTFTWHSFIRPLLATSAQSKSRKRAPVTRYLKTPFSHSCPAGDESKQTGEHSKHSPWFTSSR